MEELSYFQENVVVIVVAKLTGENSIVRRVVINVSHGAVILTNTIRKGILDTLYLKTYYE